MNDHQLQTHHKIGKEKTLAIFQRKKPMQRFFNGKMTQNSIELFLKI